MMRTSIVIISVIFSLSTTLWSQSPKRLPVPKEQVITPTVSEIVSNGRFLILSDASVWEIHPLDQMIVNAWLSPAVITVKPSEDPNFPYLLTNEDTLSSIRAKKSSIEEIYALIEEQKAEEKQRQEMIEQLQDQKPRTPSQNNSNFPSQNSSSPKATEKTPTPQKTSPEPSSPIEELQEKMQQDLENKSSTPTAQ